jgi:hypothetical protein
MDMAYSKFVALTTLSKDSEATYKPLYFVCKPRWDFFKTTAVVADGVVKALTVKGKTATKGKSPGKKMSAK